jgi:hypothetical protein
MMVLGDLRSSITLDSSVSEGRRVWGEVLTRIHILGVLLVFFFFFRFWDVGLVK